jgi:plasmid stabilization system protein ParE
MSFHVRILPRAERDAQQIFHWITQREPQGAVRWWTAFEAAVGKLADSPWSYGLAPEDKFTDAKLQQFLFKTRRGRTYRGVFIVVNNEVRVLRIRGPGQPPLEADELE